MCACVRACVCVCACVRVCLCVRAQAYIRTMLSGMQYTNFDQFNKCQNIYISHYSNYVPFIYMTLPDARSPSSHELLSSSKTDYPRGVATFLWFGKLQIKYINIGQFHDVLYIIILLHTTLKHGHSLTSQRKNEQPPHIQTERRMVNITQRDQK